MKLKNIIIALSLIVTANSIAQDRYIRNPLSVSLGVNAVDSSGKQNPYNFIFNPDELSFSNPIEAGVNYDISNAFDIYGKISLNKFQTNKAIDGAFITKSFPFIAIDLGVNYYFFTTNYSQDFYLIGGAGMTSLEKTFLTGNFGGGTKYWFNDYFGVYLNAVAKFALGDETINSNYFQYSFGITYKLSGI